MKNQETLSYFNSFSYGACRYLGSDYMYQGGCGQLVLWGQSDLGGQSQTCRYHYHLDMYLEYLNIVI